MAEAQATGASRMVLCTMPVMTGAQRLYEGLGYERQPERDWSPDGVDLISYGRAVG
jgi:ribosomal protein S18 acetylase RimI-like enzyme